MTLAAVIGLAEDWVDLLPRPPHSGVVFTDAVLVGREISTMLKSVFNCSFVIALTHMRMPNAVALALQVPEINLVLNGHDHFYEKIAMASGQLVVTSGTDFREFSEITISIPKVSGTLFSLNRPVVTCEHVQVSKKYAENLEIKMHLEDISSKLQQVFFEPIYIYRYRYIDI